MRNMTPHTINDVTTSTAYAPCGEILRIMPGGRLSHDPEAECIVSGMVLDAWGWAYPGMHAPGELVRGADGQPIGCRGLRRWEGNRSSAALRCALVLDPALADEIPCMWASVGLTDGGCGQYWQARIIRAGLPADVVFRVWPLDSYDVWRLDHATADVVKAAFASASHRARAALWQRHPEIKLAGFSAADIEEMLLLAATQCGFDRIADAASDDPSVMHYLRCRIDCADDDGWPHAGRLCRALAQIGG
jgi:hypothetical protein